MLRNWEIQGQGCHKRRTRFTMQKMENLITSGVKSVNTTQGDEYQKAWVKRHVEDESMHWHWTLHLIWSTSRPHHRHKTAAHKGTRTRIIKKKWMPHNVCAKEFIMCVLMGIICKKKRNTFEQKPSNKRRILRNHDIVHAHRFVSTRYQLYYIGRQQWAEKIDTFTFRNLF